MQIGKEYLTTPAGVSKGYLIPDMSVKVDDKGQVLAGNYAPSSEVKVHLKAYAYRKDVKADIHAHPPFATTFAVHTFPWISICFLKSYMELGWYPYHMHNQLLRNSQLDWREEIDKLLMSRIKNNLAGNHPEYIKFDKLGI